MWPYASTEAAAKVAQAEAQVAEDQRTQKIVDVFRNGLAGLKNSRNANDPKVINEIAKVVYTNCVLPDSGRLLLNSSAAEINGALGLEQAVPADPKAGQVKSDDGGSVSARSKLDDAIRRMRTSGEGTAGSGKPATPK